MSTELSNISQVITGIINSSSHLTSECGALKHKPSDLADIITKATLSNIDLTFDSFITQDTESLNDDLSLNLIFYWCWWALIAYQSPSVLTKLVPIPDKFTYYNFNTNLPGQPFFFITADPYSKSIIIAIRGTASLSDAITDGSGIMIPFIADLDVLAHTGFVTGAQNVMGLLEDILPKYLKEYPKYPIKVVGHSYGAAVTSIVCTLLEMNREMGKLDTQYPVRSFQFCCPPVYNYDGSIKVCSVNNQISIVLGWDVVPRASLNNVQLFMCEKEPHINTFTFVPGTILWITYDEETDVLKEIYAIEPSNPSLLNIHLHPNMGEDHRLSRVYGFLLSSLNRKN